jgi:uncharacterized protein YidB (DUF937 family)
LQAGRQQPHNVPFFISNLHFIQELTMSLLGSVIGAISGGGAGGGGAQGALLNAVVGMLTQGGGAAGAGGAGGALGGLGGLGGLIGKFQQAGMGDAVNSWIGTGDNHAVSPEQVGHALGGDTIAGLAQQLGMGQGDVLSQLSHMLPQVVDKLTPGGQMPQADANGGLGGLGDIAGMLGGLLKR